MLNSKRKFKLKTNISAVHTFTAEQRPGTKGEGGSEGDLQKH